MTPGLLNIQHGALSGRNTTTLTAKLVNNLHKTDGYLALRSHGASHDFRPVYLLGAVYPEGRLESAVANASAGPAMAFRPVGVPTVRRGVARIVDGNTQDVLCVREDVGHLLCVLGWFVGLC